VPVASWNNTTRVCPSIRGPFYLTLQFARLSTPAGRARAVLLLLLLPLLPLLRPTAHGPSAADQTGPSGKMGALFSCHSCTAATLLLNWRQFITGHRLASWLRAS